MFKTLIKKVREESSNSSILPENNNSDEINGHLTKENNNSFDEENSSLRHTHRKLFEIYDYFFFQYCFKGRSNSTTQHILVNKSRLSSHSNEVR